MTTMLEECTNEDRRSVVRFCGQKGLNAKDIRKEMFPVYFGKCLTRNLFIFEGLKCIEIVEIGLEQSPS
jgi:hypothetical protein